MNLFNRLVVAEACALTFAGERDSLLESGVYTLADAVVQRIQQRIDALSSGAEL